MASEIRANTLKNRVGLGTVSFTNTGTVVSGIVTANTIRLADDNKIQLGNDQDLEIVHDPSNGIIRSISSGGNMHVESKNHIELNVNYNPSNGSKHNAIKANANSSVSLYHANSTKFATTSTGAQVYGTLVATGADINGDLDVDGHTELDNINISGVSTHVGLSQFQNTINLTHASAGQNYIYFNEDLQFAKNGTGTRLKIDSNGVVGINTDASGNGSGAKLVVGGRVQSNNGGYWFADANGAENGWHVQDSGGNLIIVESGVAERLRIGSSGQIGLGGANYGSSGQVLTSGGSGSAATWSTVSGTTINSNADNRVITGSGTANTLNGESNLTFTGSLLTVTGNISLPDSSAPDYIGNIYVGNNSDLKIFHNGSDNFIRSGTNTNIRIDNNSGVLGARFIPAGSSELYHNGSLRAYTAVNGFYAEQA